MKPKKYNFKCEARVPYGEGKKLKRCTCGDDLEIFDFHDDEIEIGGVILSEKSVRKLITLLTNIYVKEK